MAGRRSVSARPPAQRCRPAPTGAHFLAPRLAAELVRSAAVGPDDLVLDLGAGLGALTAPLAATGARVLAVELNREYARRLAARFAGTTNVRVVSGDLRTVPLPRRDFRVVANIPFATTSVLLRRLLDPGASRLVRADLVVEHGVARRLTGVPRDERALWWAARYRIGLVRTLPRHCFTPPPAVDAALLTVSRPPMTARAEQVLRSLLAAVARDPGGAARAVVRASAARLAGAPPDPRAAGIEPGQPAGSVAPQCWRALAELSAPGTGARGASRAAR